jgi:hypothetical protein
MKLRAHKRSKDCECYPLSRLSDIMIDRRELGGMLVVLFAVLIALCQL